MPNLNSHRNTILKKLKDNPSFVGYYLQKYCDLEDLKYTEIIDLLACNEDDYLKIALCQTASPLSPEFAQSIDKISRYVSLNDFSLSQIMKKVAITEKQRSGKIIAIRSNKNLMAAREKEDNSEKEDNE